MSAGTVLFACSACGFKARVPEMYAGRTIRCPGCQVPHQVPAVEPGEKKQTARITRVIVTPEPMSLSPEQMAALTNAVRTSDTGTGRFGTGRVGTASFRTPLQTDVSRGTGTSAFRSSQPPEAGRPGTASFRPSTTDPARPGTASFRAGTGAVPRPGTSSFRAPPRRLVTPLPVASAAPEGVDFLCNACNAKMRLPRHYVGRNILCPKCSHPQVVVDPSQPLEPMDTTRALHRAVEVEELQAADALVETVPMILGETTARPPDGPLRSPASQAPRRTGTSGPMPTPASGVSASPLTRTATPVKGTAPIAHRTATPAIQAAVAAAEPEADPVSEEDGSDEAEVDAEPAIQEPAPVHQTAPRWAWPVVAALGLACLALGFALALTAQASSNATTSLERALADRTAAERRAEEATSDLRQLRAKMDDLQAELAILRAKVVALETPVSLPSQPAAGSVTAVHGQ